MEKVKAPETGWLSTETACHATLYVPSGSPVCGATGDSLLLGYAFHLIGQLMTQPPQVILAGRIGNTGSCDTGMRLWKLAPDPVDLMMIDGAGHYEMYDEPGYVDAAVERLTNFYVDNL